MTKKNNKKLKIKPTIRQIRAVKGILENNVEQSRSLGEIMLNSGYSKSTSKAPELNLLSKPAVKTLLEQECAKAGLTTDLILKSLVDDIKSKEANRVPELTLASRITRLIDTRDEQSRDVNINVLNVSYERARDIISARTKE